MPRGFNKGGSEKSRDFSGAMKRLFKELANFRLAILIALILAAGGSILSIYAPNKLSSLTDEISEGITVDGDKITEVSETITTNVTSLDMTALMMSEDISSDVKNEVMNVLAKADVNDPKAMLSAFGELSDEAKESIFASITIDGAEITAKDQLAYLNVLSTLDENAQPSDLYGAVDEMPTSIQELIVPHMDMSAIQNIVFFLACLYILSAVFTFIQAWVMSNVSNGFARDLRERISTKINRLPLKFFDAHQSGDILSRVTNDVDTIAQSMNNSLSTLVSSTTLFIGSIVMMFVTNATMAFTAIGSSLIGFVLMFVILGKSQKYFKARQVELGKLNSHIEETYSGLNIVKAYNGRVASDVKFDAANASVYEANWKSQFLSGLMQPLMTFIGNFGYVAVCVVGALLAMDGKITFGVIVAFITYVRLFTNPLSQIAQAFTSLQSTAAASERVFEFLDEAEMEEEHVNVVLDKDQVKGHIEFENVSFGYDEDRTIIKNFTAQASPGQKVAIVGPTGAGKTTMVNLLMKFYNIKSGDIKIDGVSTRDLSRSNIHDLFTMVLQDTWLFEGSVRDNIVYNHEGVDDKVLDKVCEDVGLTHFIKTLPRGYDSALTESDSVSAGQKQLLTIARAMIEDKPFLILDEATSNVDTRTEELVQAAMDKLTVGKTSFIIAHRLSTIKNADLILVMKDGNIIESGNHDELMNQGGFYSDLYNSQFDLLED